MHLFLSIPVRLVTALSQRFLLSMVVVIGLFFILVLASRGTSLFDVVFIFWSDRLRCAPNTYIVIKRRK